MEASPALSSGHAQQLVSVVRCVYLRGSSGSPLETRKKDTFEEIVHAKPKEQEQEEAGQTSWLAASYGGYGRSHSTASSRDDDT